MVIGIKEGDKMQKIYLDNAATAESTSDIVMFPIWGNPSSMHSVGKYANLLLNTARKIFLDFLNAPDGGTIIFTSGGTESNNLAIMGLKKYLRSKEKKHIVTTRLEHPSVANCCLELKENEEFCVSYVDVDSSGRVSLPHLESILHEFSDVGLVSIQMVNSEIGTLQPIKEIGELCRKHGVLFHTDAVQGFGHYEIDVQESNIDLLSMSGHKIHSFKGIGALYVKDKTLLSPILFGGGQQYGLRSGTENIQGISNIAEEVSAVYQSRAINIWQDYYKDLWASFEVGFDKTIGDLKFWYNGEGYGGHIMSLTIPHVEASAMVMMLDKKGVCVSNGSACHSNSLEPSTVLKEIGLNDEDALCTIRVSFSDWNTIDEAERAGMIIGETANEIYGIE